MNTSCSPKDFILSSSPIRNHFLLWMSQDALKEEMLCGIFARFLPGSFRWEWGFTHPSQNKQLATLVHCKCLKTLRCQWGALDADVPGEVSCGVSAAMDDVPFTNLTGTCLVWGLILPHPSVAIQSGSWSELKLEPLTVVTFEKAAVKTL